MKRVLWLISDRMGCGVYRAYVPALSLEAAMVTDSHFVAHEDVKADDFEEHFRDVEIAVFQRAVGPVFLNWIAQAKRWGVRTVFELDDHLFHVPRGNPAAWFWNQRRVQKALHQQLDAVDAITVSTRPLMQAVHDFMDWRTPHPKVTLCMNHLHPSVWGPEIWGGSGRYANTGGVVIGWQGSQTHDSDFREILPALKRLLAEYPDLWIRFFGNVPLSVKGQIPTDRFQWLKGVPFERYPSTLHYANFDIGVAPITASAFNKAKSNLKWLEYSALSLPCVASKVYPYARSIEHGRTGFLADTTPEWYAALKLLIDSKDLRQQIGAQAHTHVWETWSHVQHMPAWTRALGLNGVKERTNGDDEFRVLRGAAQSGVRADVGAERVRRQLHAGGARTPDDVL